MERHAPGMSKRLLAIMALAAVATPAMAKPRWTLSNADNKCVLMKERAGGDAGFMVRPIAGTGEYELTLLLPKRETREFTVAGSLGNGSPDDYGAYMFHSEEPGNSPDRQVHTRIARDKLALVARKELLVIDAPTKLNLRLNVEGINRAFEALQSCEGSLASR